MNTREAMQALLNGKKLRGPGDRPWEYVHLNNDGELVTQSNGAVVVPCWTQYSIYEEPNPHTKGTFAWAREEAKRGKAVRRADFSPGDSVYKGAWYSNNSCWSLEDIDAMDWETL